MNFTGDGGFRVFPADSFGRVAPSLIPRAALDDGSHLAALAVVQRAPPHVV